MDVLLNNAGQSATSLFEDQSAAQVRNLFEVNVFGVMEVTRALLPHFRQQRSGVIATVSSAAGIIGTPLGSVYSATKFAVEGFSESLAFELEPFQVVVKLLEPGAVRTDMFARAQAHTERAEYLGLVARINQFYTTMASDNIAEVSDTAENIYNALTDGTTRLRYAVTDGAEQFIKLRRDLPEEQYVDTLRSMLRDIPQPTAVV